MAAIICHTLTDPVHVNILWQQFGFGVTEKSRSRDWQACTSHPPSFQCRRSVPWRGTRCTDWRRRPCWVCCSQTWRHEEKQTVCSPAGRPGATSAQPFDPNHAPSHTDKTHTHVLIQYRHYIHVVMPEFNQYISYHLQLTKYALKTNIHPTPFIMSHFFTVYKVLISYLSYLFSVFISFLLPLDKITRMNRLTLMPLMSILMFTP